MEAASDPSPSYQWYLFDPAVRGNWRVLEGENGNRLRIASARTSAKYRVLASNLAGTIQTEADVVVVPRLKLQGARMGNDLQLSCEAVSTQAIHLEVSTNLVQWNRIFTYSTEASTYRETILPNVARRFYRATQD